MTKEEMSVEFDLLYNNIMSNLAPGLDNYEKSRFLTMAQEAIVREYYNGISPLSNSFEKNEAMRRSLANLIKSYSTRVDSTYTYNVETNYTITRINPIGQYPLGVTDVPSRIVIGNNLKDYIVRIPKKVMFIILEYGVYKDDYLKCFNNKEIAIIPVTHDEFIRIKENPFKGPNLRRILRLDVGRRGTLDDVGNPPVTQSNIDNLNMQAIELISKYELYSYTMRYLRKPDPIIIETIDNDVPIDGCSNAMDCKLAEIIHRDIVERAVQIASAVYKGSATNNK